MDKLAKAFAESKKSGQEMKYLLHAEYNIMNNTWTINNEEFRKLVDEVHQSNKDYKQLAEEFEEYKHNNPEPDPEEHLGVFRYIPPSDSLLNFVAPMPPCCQRGSCD